MKKDEPLTSLKNEDRLSCSGDASSSKAVPRDTPEHHEQKKKKTEGGFKTTKLAPDKFGLCGYVIITEWNRETYQNGDQKEVSAPMAYSGEN